MLSHYPGAGCAMGSTSVVPVRALVFWTRTETPVGLLGAQSPSLDQDGTQNLGHNFKTLCSLASWCSGSPILSASSNITLHPFLSLFLCFCWHLWPRMPFFLLSKPWSSWMPRSHSYFPKNPFLNERLLWPPPLSCKSFTAHAINQAFHYVHSWGRASSHWLKREPTVQSLLIRETSLW